MKSLNGVCAWGTTALLSFVVLVAGSAVQAKTCTWIASGGSWDDAAKWADGALPEDGDEVIVSGVPVGGVLNLGGGTTAKLTALRHAEIAAPAGMPSSPRPSIRASATSIVVTVAPSGTLLVVR